MICLTEMSGRLKIELTCISMGKDLCVVISGGEIPHLGAMAVAQVRASLADPAKLSSSTSVITLVGHKEDALAKEVAEKLAVQLNKNIVTCCGIHLDDGTKDEINIVSDMVNKMIQVLITQYKE